MILVQREDFDPGAELERLTAGRQDIGAVASFIGLVRGEGVTAMTLEHYPGMTERQLARIEAEARSRWPVQEITLIHRFGRLLPGERIVLVLVAAAHRGSAFQACEFLIDWLKTQAPFWKLEEGASGARWVEAKEDDVRKAAHWTAAKN
jgi:molybdopterin synthase catalytic subunit